MTRPSESGHFYKPDGTPVYEVPYADGRGMRPTTLKDARKMGLYPGVTTIIRQAAAPGLELWKQKQVLLASRTIAHIEGETDEELIARILADAGEEAKQARERGTAIHAAIQGHFEGMAPAPDDWPYVKGVLDLLRANFGAQEWKAEAACAHPLGFGTKVDLHASAILLDFKGAEFEEGEEFHALKTWDEHHMQLAAGRKAKNMDWAECAIVYVSRTVPGLAKLCRVEESELERGWKMFQGLHAYWCAKSNYYPSRCQGRVVV